MNSKLKEAIKRILKVIQLTGDQAMYMHQRIEPHGSKEWDGTIGTYVGDLLCSVTEEFKRRTDELRDEIKIKN